MFGCTSWLELTQLFEVLLGDHELLATRGAFFTVALDTHYLLFALGTGDDFRACFTGHDSAFQLVTLFRASPTFFMTFNKVS